METFLILAMAGTSVILPLWLGQRYGLIAFASPMHLLAAFALLGFAAKVLAYAYVPDLAFYPRFVDRPGAFLRGALYLTGFVLFVCLGYRLAVRPADPPKPASAVQKMAARPARQGWLFAGAFGVAGLTLVLILRARGIDTLSTEVLGQVNRDKQIGVNSDGVGATLAGIKTLFIVPKLAFVVMLARALVLRSIAQAALCAALGALLVAVALVSGDRFELFEMLIYALAIWAIFGGRLGARQWLVAALALWVALLATSHMTALRGQDTGLWRQVIGSTYFLDINVSVLVTDKVQPAQMLWGESYGWWSFGWVPRAIWPEKPAIDLGVYLKQEVLGQRTGGAFNVTGPGEAFINFGWWGIGVGGALGWLYRRGEVFLLASRHATGQGGVYYYPLLLCPFVQATLQSSFSAFVVSAVVQGVIIAAVIALCLTRIRSGPEQTGGWIYAG